MNDIKKIILDTPEQSLENIISPFIEEQFPSFVRADHRKLVLFIKTYYEWLEKKDNTGYVLSKLDSVGDIDNNAEEFYQHFKNTYMDSFPEVFAVNVNGESPNKKTLLKKIREFYGNKGTESAYRFLFRLLYDNDLEFYYPKEDILRVSDGVWIEPKSVKTTTSAGNGILGTINGTLTQYSSVDSSIIASAGIEDIVQYSSNGLQITEFFLKNISGVFLPDVEVVAKGVDTSYTEKTYSVLGEFFIETSGQGYSVGDVLFIVSSGTGFLAKVGVTGLAGSIKRISIEDSGINYFSKVEAIVISSTGASASSKVILLPTAITNYPGYFKNNRGKISSNKKIQDGHYYQEFSYVLKSAISFDVYFDALKFLTHPSGMRMFGEILMKSDLVMTHIPFSQYTKIDTPIIGNYAPYRLETVLDLRANGAVTATGYTSGVGDLSWRGLSGANLGGTNQDNSEIIVTTASTIPGTVGAISNQNYADNVDLSFKATVPGYVYVGLNTNPSITNLHHDNIDYAWHMWTENTNGYAFVSVQGVYQVIPNNQLLQPHNTYSSISISRVLSDVFSVRYRNGKIAWYRNGVLLVEQDPISTHTSGMTLSAQIAGSGSITTISDIQYNKFVFHSVDAGDLYPAGYNPYISSSLITLSGVSSPVGTIFVGLSGGYTYATVPEDGITTHNPLGYPVGSSASWTNAQETNRIVTSIAGNVLWLKPEGLVAIGGGSAAGASLGIWTDASPQQNHGVLPTWDRWNDTVVYARQMGLTAAFRSSLWNTNEATNVEWRVGNYGNIVSGVSASHGNQIVVGFFGSTGMGGTGPLGTGGNTTNGYDRLDFAWGISQSNNGVPQAYYWEAPGSVSGINPSGYRVVGLTGCSLDTVFGISHDKVNNLVVYYLNGVVGRTVGVSAGVTFWIDSSWGGATGTNIEILKAEYDGVPLSVAGWTSTSSTNGVTFTINTGNTMEFLAPKIVKNDMTVTGRDGLQFNGGLLCSPYTQWNGPTGTANTLRSNPELNFIRGSSVEGILKGTHFYLTRGLSLSTDMDAFIVCRSDEDAYYTGRWFVGSHRKLQGITEDTVFFHTSHNSVDRTTSLANNSAYYSTVILSNVSGATAIAYDSNTGVVGFRPAGPNTSGVQKTMAYDPHVSLYHIGTSIGEWTRDENYAIESFFNGDASRNYSPSTGRYRSTVTSPYKIEHPGFTSSHLLEIGRFGNGPRNSTITTLAGKNWLEDTLTWSGGGITFTVGGLSYSSMYKGKLSYRVQPGSTGDVFLEYGNYDSLAGATAEYDDWTFSAYLKRFDSVAITTVGVNIYGPTAGSTGATAAGTVTSVEDGWYHVKRSLSNHTHDGVYPLGVTLSSVGFYGLSHGVTYTISGAMLERYPIHAPVGSTAWSDAVLTDTKYGFSGVINEILVFNRKLKEDERQIVYGYLSKKYSLSDALPNSFSLTHPGAQRVGDQFWEIKHHPNTIQVTSIIPSGISFGNIRIGDFLNMQTSTYRSIGYEQANGVDLSEDTYTEL